MKQRIWYWIILSILMLLVAGCPPSSPPSGEPTVEPPPVEPSGDLLAKEFIILHSSETEEPPPRYSVDQRNAACLPIYPFDEGEAHLKSTKEKPILWTFGVNFDELSTAHNPLGCLRLYHRGGSKLVPIDGGGFIVDTCRFKNLSGTGVVVDSSGIASFNGGGYIECEMNLGGWVKNWVDNPDGSEPRFPDGLDGEVLKRVLETFYFDTDKDIARHEHTYANFTIVAKIELSPNVIVSLYPRRLPIVYFKQIETEPTLPSLSVWRQEDGFTFPATYCYDDQNKIRFEPEGYDVWWYDVQLNLTRYVHKNPVQECKAPFTEDPMDPMDPMNPVQFGIEKTSLYIGYDPGYPENAFFGSIDEILIDPTDSKPPL